MYTRNFFKVTKVRKKPLEKKGSSCQYCDKKIGGHSAHIRLHEAACHMNPTNIKHCLYCDEVLSFGEAARNKSRDVRQKKFCNRSCAAKYNNPRRVVTEEHKNNIRNGINIFYDESPDFRKYDADEKEKKSNWIKKYHRYTIQQLRKLKPKLYEYWQSNPYPGYGDTSKLSIEHGGDSKVEIAYERAMKYNLSIPEVFNIEDIEIIPYAENHRREMEFRRQRTREAGELAEW